VDLVEQIRGHAGHRRVRHRERKCLQCSVGHLVNKTHTQILPQTSTHSF
jgi:hypothetical protein